MAFLQQHPDVGWLNAYDDPHWSHAPTLGWDHHWSVQGNALIATTLHIPVRQMLDASQAPFRSPFPVDSPPPPEDPAIKAKREAKAAFRQKVQALLPPERAFSQLSTTLAESKDEGLILTLSAAKVAPVALFVRPCAAGLGAFIAIGDLCFSVRNDGSLAITQEQESLVHRVLERDMHSPP